MIEDYFLTKTDDESVQAVADDRGIDLEEPNMFEDASEEDDDNQS